MPEKKFESAAEKQSQSHSGIADLTDPITKVQIGQGPVRPYLITTPDERLPALRIFSSIKEKLLVSVLITFTAVVRLYNLEWPNSVVFDEVHFGGFASEYIRGTFFFDVHPPLAKMLFAGVGSLAGFKGDFDFEHIGDEFPQTTPYFMMRLFSATLGSLTVILMYFTLRSSGVRMWVSLVAALCFAIENSYVTISRYILLDAPLIFFIAAAVYSFKKYELYPESSFGSYKALLATGIALGFAASSKWVGLFTVAWVGLLCIWRLWFMVGDLKKPVSYTFKVAISKLVFLLGVPIALYVVFFYIHFETLTIDGPGASFYSSAFRSTLENNHIPKEIEADVGVGSTISMRHFGTSGGYLHSHLHNYPTGSQQQQVTLYSHIDPNNEWLIELATSPGITYPDFKNLTDGSVVRLLHTTTFCRLHSHDHPAPVSESADWQKEVSCYGYTGYEGDANDNWVVEIDQELSAPGEARERVRAIETKFRLKHMLTNCYLFSHDVNLPKWGFDQQEVSCATAGKYPLTVWYVEDNKHPELSEDAERVSYTKLGFFGKFLESHSKMWSVNKNLVEPHVSESQPTEWPFLLRGIAYWGHHHRTVYLFGNAIEWWAVTAFIGIFTVVCVIELFAWQLGKPILQDDHVFNFHVQVTHYLLGYALHLAPSFLMKRQMFLHHYLPAYYFGILAFGHALDIIVTFVFRNRKAVGKFVVIAFFACCYFFFDTYRPLIYGTTWTQPLCEKSKWLTGWGFNCGSYFETYAEYNNYTMTSQFDAADSNETPISTMDGPLQVDEPVQEEYAQEEQIDEQQQVNEKPKQDITNDFPPAVQDEEAAEPLPNDASFDQVVNNKNFNRFVDENGIEVPIEEVMAMMAQNGDAIKIEQKMVDL